MIIPKSVIQLIKDKHYIIAKVEYISSGLVRITGEHTYNDSKVVRLCTPLQWDAVMQRFDNMPVLT